MRELIAKPLGLITQPNKVGEFAPGAMSRADGLRMLNPGELEPFKASSQYAPGAGAAGQYCQRLFTTGPQLLAFKNPIPATSTFRLDWMTAGAANQALSIDPNQFQFQHSRVIPMLFRGRTLVNGSRGVSVFDYVNPTSSAERTMRWAQLPKPLLYVQRPSLAGQFINSLTALSLSCVIKRVYADGYELISEPAQIAAIRNEYGFTCEARVDVIFAAVSSVVGQVVAGDVVEFYRSREVASPTAGLDQDPGSTLYLCGTHTITSGEATAGKLSATLNAEANQIVGKELYTNPGQESLQSSRAIPPVSKATAAYKGYAFYANVTLPGAWESSIVSGWGLLGSVATDLKRANGVGLRRFVTGTFTSGSPTITGISAAEMVGVQVGQMIYDFGVRVPGALSTPTYASATKIIGITASTITMSANALGSGAASPAFYTADVVEIDGSHIAWGWPAMAIQSLDLDTTNFYRFAADRTIPVEGLSADPGTFYGVTTQLSPSRYTQNSGVITVRGTNGQNHTPPIPLLTQAVKTFAAEAKPNYLYWSWEQQPECVPPGNYVPIGRDEIDALTTTRDAMWIWCSDGLQRFTGYGTRPSGIQANWRADLIDARIRLASPTSYCVMNEFVFAYTNQGFVRVSDAYGLEYLSRGVVGDLIPGAAWAETPIYSMAANPVLNEVWLNIATPSLTSGDRVLTIVWNNVYGVFTVLNQRVGDDNTTYLTAVEFSASVGSMMMGISRTSGASGQIDYHDPASNTYAAWTMDFQPLYGPDPMSSKQWCDITAIFDPASAPKSITPRFNEVAAAYSNPTAVYPSTRDSRVSFGVPQDAPAIAALIAPGFSGAQVTGVTRFRAFSPRFSVFNEQQLVR